MAPTVLQPSKSTARPKVLVVDDEPELIELICDVFARTNDCRLVAARDLREAEAIIKREPVDLLLADVRLPDGDGMSLLPKLHDANPAAAAVVITGEPSLTGAIDAMRAGVVDFLPKPFSAEHLLARVRSALKIQAAAARTHKRLGRLKVAVRRLNTIRRTISKKVDILCNDLVSAYGELSKQVDQVRLAEGFRKVLDQARDLEQLLCHAMDWLLRQVGYCNVAVWLASEEHVFELGAYMKYTIAGDVQLTDAMKNGILPLVTRENLVLLEGETVKDKLTAAECEYLHNQSVMAVNCTYLGESLAAIVMFRDARSPFTDADVAAVQAVAPLFAVALANVVRHAENGHDDDYGGGSGGGNGDGNDDGDGAGGGGAGTSPFSDDSIDRDGTPRDPRKDKKDNRNNKNAKKKDKLDAADWWKRGEAPPF
jgi:DNA-binding response OmpR family regulator